jgi:hypothetical protein
MDTKPKEQPAAPADVKSPPVRVSDPGTPDSDKRRVQPALDPHQAIEEPGYGHGV